MRKSVVGLSVLGVGCFLFVLYSAHEFYHRNLPYGYYPYSGRYGEITPVPSHVADRSIVVPAPSTVVIPGRDPQERIENLKRLLRDIEVELIKEETVLRDNQDSLERPISITDGNDSSRLSLLRDLVSQYRKCQTLRMEIALVEQDILEQNRLSFEEIATDEKEVLRKVREYFAVNRPATQSAKKGL